MHRLPELSRSSPNLAGQQQPAQVTGIMGMQLLMRGVEESIPNFRK